MKAIDRRDGSTVDGQPVDGVGQGSDGQPVAHRVAVVYGLERRQATAVRYPQRVAFHVKVHTSGIDVRNGCVKLEDDGVAHVDGAALGQIHAEFGCFVGINVLQFLDFLEFSLAQFLALGSCLLLFFQQLGEPFGTVLAFLGFLLFFLDLGT